MTALRNYLFKNIFFKKALPFKIQKLLNILDVFIYLCLRFVACKNYLAYSQFTLELLGSFHMLSIFIKHVCVYIYI